MLTLVNSRLVGWDQGLRDHCNKNNNFSSMFVAEEEPGGERGKGEWGRDPHQ